MMVIVFVNLELKFYRTGTLFIFYFTLLSSAILRTTSVANNISTKRCCQVLFTPGHQ